MKTCSVCHESKALEQFHNDAGGAQGRRASCKVCRNMRQKAWQQVYYLKHKEEISIKHKKKWALQPKKIRVSKKYAKVSEAQQKINRREYQRKWRKNKRDSDISFKIRCNLGTRISNAVKRSFSQKKVKTIDLLGCSIAQLKNHLEANFQSGMTWDNYGKWHIDHIVPCASFDLSVIENQTKCFHYSNLQPLWSKDNLHKSDRIY